MLLMVVIIILQLFMNTKIIFWNCQGVGHLRFHNFIIEYSRDFTSDNFLSF